MKKQLGRSPKRVALYAIAGGLAVIVIAFLVVYFVIFPTSSPKPFTLSSTTATSATTAAGTGATGTARQSTSSTGLSGTWMVAGGSQAGYRVREKLAFLPAESDAVGRTSQITGSAGFTQSRDTIRITAASFKVAVNTLTSDRSMRDEKIHEIGLESSRYPTATFALTTPVTISASALNGKVAHVSVTGTFDIHGVAKKETLPVEMSLSGSTFEAVGSLTFPWSEFGMTAPSIGGFVNVTEKATMEFDLHMQRT
jgi:polyisoprenoid-binding protein YceI